MKDKILKLARYLKSIKCYDELDYLGTVYSMYSGESIGESKCIPIDQWEGVPEGFAIFTHSTSSPIKTFESMITDGFRVSRAGLGNLSITFLDEDPKALKESLQWRVNPENKNYNLGSMVVIAAINPNLMTSEGISDDVLKIYKDGEGDPIGPGKVKNVKVLEEWGKGHQYHDRYWKLPGRFLYAAYNGANDTICINPDWDGMEGTELGDNMEKNYEEFLSLDVCHSTRYHDTDENNIISNIKSYDNEFDDDIF